MPNPNAESGWEKEFYKEYFKGEFGWHYNADHTRQPEIEVDKLLPFISTQIEEAKKGEREKIVNLLRDLEVDLIETTSKEYDDGWNDCNLKWNLRITDIERELFKAQS